MKNKPKQKAEKPYVRIKSWFSQESNVLARVALYSGLIIAAESVRRYFMEYQFWTVDYVTFCVMIIVIIALIDVWTFIYNHWDDRDGNPGIYDDDYDGSDPW